MPRPWLAHGELGQRGRDLAHDPVAGLDQQPAHALHPAAGVEVDDVGGEVLQLGQALDAGVAAAHEHVGQELLALARVVDRLGHLERAQHVVAQRDGLGQRLEPDRVLGQAGDRQRPRPAQRDDQVVVLDALVVASSVG
jgi:hypothetical protein